MVKTKCISEEKLIKLQYEVEKMFYEDPELKDALLKEDVARLFILNGFNENEEVSQIVIECFFNEEMFSEEEDFDFSEYKEEESSQFLTEKEKNRLAEENMAWVGYAAGKFINTGIDIDDLKDIALSEYHKALLLFKSGLNVKFSTFAYKCMVNKLIYYTRKEKRFINKSTSLSNTISVDNDGNNLSVEDRVPFIQDSLDDIIVKKENINALKEVINDYLDEQEQFIIKSRFGIDSKILTQNELAEELGMSQANISKKEKSILEKIKNILISEYKIKESM